MTTYTDPNQPKKVTAKPGVPMSSPNAAPAPAPDPFASIGGGVQVNGGWVPKGHPAAAQTPIDVQAPPLTPVEGGPAQPGTSGPDPFASIGGGVKLPSGEWVPQGHPAAGQPAATTPATPGASPAAGAATPGAQPQPTTVADAFKQSLISMLNGNNQTPSLNDPALKAQSDAFSVGQQRAAEIQRAQAAERQAMQGGAGVSSGAFDSDVSGINERMGANMAGFNAQLVGDELKQRRQQLLQAAALAGNQLNAEEARKLQRELAELDAAIRREGIAQQGALGQSDIDLRGRLGEGQLNLGLLSALLNNQQFGQSLAQQGAQFGAGLDNQTLLALIGGL